jgi:2'-5' RNA ligase
MERIDEIRRKYDPAESLVRPHITLVFPFESAIGEKELAEHVAQCLIGAEPFSLSLHGISAQKGFGNYLLLNVHTGKNTIKDLHRRLYSGLLEQYKPHWCRTFEPHMTVGKIDDDDQFAIAVTAVADMDDCFETCVSEIAIEVIGPDGSSQIESTFQLKAVQSA